MFDKTPDILITPSDLKILAQVSWFLQILIFILEHERLHLC
jgi:hypothetical protein